MERFPVRTAGLVLGTGLVFAGQASGAGFALIENSASGQGNAFAGDAVATENASAAWSNPAGLTRFGDTRVSVATHVIDVTADYRDRGSWLDPDYTQGQRYPGSLRGEDADGGKTVLVPTAFYSRPLGEDWALGFSVNAPFGLETDYDADWVGRYHALNSELITINLNPSLAWRVSDRVSLAAGLSAQYAEAKLTRAVPDPQAPFTGPDGRSKLEGSNWGWGYNLGLMIQATPATRLGLTYRSSVEHTLEGDVEVQFNGAPTIAADAEADLDLPHQWGVGLAHELDGSTTLLFGATRTGWSRFDELEAVATEASVLGREGATLTYTDEDWEDTWRLSAGLNYDYSERLRLRTGIAWDESPIPDAEHRTPRIPGNGRTWFSLGIGYALTPHLTADAGYTHLFVDDTDIRSTEPGIGTLNGNYDHSANLFSLQLSWRM